MNARILIISVNLTTEAPTALVLQGIQEYVSSMDEVGPIGETNDRVHCNQVVVIEEVEL